MLSMKPLFSESFQYPFARKAPSKLDKLPMSLLVGSWWFLLSFFYAKTLQNNVAHHSGRYMSPRVFSLGRCLSRPRVRAEPAKDGRQIISDSTRHDYATCCAHHAEYTAKQAYSSEWLRRRTWICDMSDSQSPAFCIFESMAVHLTLSGCYPIQPKPYQPQFCRESCM